MDVRIEQSWKEDLRDEFEKPYFAALVRYLHAEKAAGKLIYPPGSQIFRAFDLTPLDQVKVVILGQDPYHGAGQAMGLSFSVPDGVPAPPSLRNMFKEIESDLGVTMSGRPNLEPWARQGVLLLNAALTVLAGAAASHSRIGWQEFTDAVIHTVSERCDGVPFLGVVLRPGRHRVSPRTLRLARLHVAESFADIADPYRLRAMMASYNGLGRMLSGGPEPLFAR